MDYFNKERRMKYVVQYKLPHEHVVQVGIEADNRNEALDTAQTLFDEGSIWDDTPEVPLLLDDFYEEGDAGVPLEFTIEAKNLDQWPKVDGSVETLRRRDAAFRASTLLVDAYKRGKESGGTVSWSDLDAAYAEALKAA